MQLTTRRSGGRAGGGRNRGKGRAMWVQFRRSPFHLVVTAFVFLGGVRDAWPAPADVWPSGNPSFHCPDGGRMVDALLAL